MEEFKSISKQIGLNFRHARTKKGYTQEKFAEIANVHVNYIGKIERGEQNLTIKSMVELSNSLNTPTKDILSIN
ncbi:MAG: helix-turn-helix transcriptional regulator [Candidatus Gastranaerophilales bacterium]